MTPARPIGNSESREFDYLCVDDFIQNIFSARALATAFEIGLIDFFIQNPDGSSRLAGADYFLFFTLLMLATAMLFTLVVRYYRGESYIHDERPAGT